MAYVNVPFSKVLFERCSERAFAVYVGVRIASLLLSSMMLAFGGQRLNELSRQNGIMLGAGGGKPVSVYHLDIALQKRLTKRLGR